MKKILSLLLFIGAVGMLNAQLTPEQVVSQNCGITITDVDISATGTLLGNGDDVAFPVTLPFAFTFPGGTVTSDIAVATNGYISSDPADGGPDLSNDCPLPATPSTGSGARLYPLHDDLDVVSGTGNVYGQALAIAHPIVPGLTSYVIFYDNVGHFAAAGTWDMGVVLWSNGDFAFIYGAGNPEDGLGSTTGVQNELATEGTEFVPCNAGGVGFGTTVESICVLSDVEIVPTMGEWGLMILGLSLMIFGVVAVRSRKLILAKAKF